MNINQLRSAKRFTPDKFFIGLTRILGIGLIVLIFGILITLLSYSWASIHKFGLPFLWHGAWDPVSNNFGAGIIILGTLVTSAIGMVIAIPLSFGIAILITQVLPDRLGAWVARLVELMAGIPSIIYGMWGLFVLGPFLARHVQPFLIIHTQHIPILNFVFGGISIGIGIFTAGIILGIMVVPLISSVMRDVLASVPEVMKEAAYGVGMTRWEVVRNILVPYTRAGMLGGIILGFGRA
ncbi:MAG: phosphate ABC transporter permease subunit PstC, partial [Gammaproteobacteria bacterium]|nr:phosphate ABC transporter permease subunit PstC [Gammaproteobacteria bacterium]